MLVGKEFLAWLSIWTAAQLTANLSEADIKIHFDWHGLNMADHCDACFSEIRNYQDPLYNQRTNSL